MIDKLKEIKEKYLKVEKELSNPETVKDIKKYTSLNKEYKSLGKIVKKYDEHSQTLSGIREAKKVLESEKDEKFRSP